jgi:hypothetical protein
MFNIPEDLATYCADRDVQIIGILGAGKDGTVYETNKATAIKVHVEMESYEHERNVYLRLQECDLGEVCGLRIPRLIKCHDNLRLIEMTLVTPPYILDFASAWLDRPPDFSQEVLDQWHEQVRENFGERFGEIMGVLELLGNRAGVYLLDIHTHNVKFEKDNPA